jgi:hypothetical protein
MELYSKEARLVSTLIFLENKYKWNLFLCLYTQTVAKVIAISFYVALQTWAENFLVDSLAYEV